MQRVALEAHQVQGRVTGVKSIGYPRQDFLPVGHVITEVIRVSQGICPVDLEEGLIEGFCKESLGRQGLPHLMMKAR